MIRVVSNGRFGGTRIFDELTGEDVTRRAGVCRIGVQIEGSKRPEITLEIGAGCAIDVSGTPRWYARNPRTGETQELRCMEFTDGTRVEFDGELADFIGLEEAGAA